MSGRSERGKRADWKSALRPSPVLRRQLDLPAQVLQRRVELLVLVLAQLLLALLALVVTLDRLEVTQVLRQVATLLRRQLDHLVRHDAPFLVLLAARRGLVQVLAVGPPERRRRVLDLRL